MLKYYTRATLSLLIILTLVFCGIFAAKEPSYLSTDAKQNKTKTVIIDAGHGGLTNTIN